MDWLSEHFLGIVQVVGIATVAVNGVTLAFALVSRRRSLAQGGHPEESKRIFSASVAELKAKDEAFIRDRMVGAK